VEHAELQRWLQQTPFQSFCVILRDGRQFNITHPRMNQLAPGFIKIGIGASDLKPPLCDHGIYVLLKDIERVEASSQTVPPEAS
jgi:hypothetical protein